MFKTEAINLLGGSPSDAAVAMGVSYQAVNKWPDKLPDRIADRVLGVCLRRGIRVPPEFTDIDSTSMSVAQSSEALTTDPVLAAHFDKAAQAGLVLLPKADTHWDGVEQRHFVRRAEDRERLDLDAGKAKQV